MNISIIGASGAVGQELLTLLAERRFPCDKLRLFGSARSAGTTYHICRTDSTGQTVEEDLTVEELTQATPFLDEQIVFASAGATVSRQFAEQITRHGAVLIDNSSAFRMDSDVPLVVPEVNPGDINLALQDGGRRIIANPNCTTIIMVVVLNAIEALAHIKCVRVASYQSASGAGAAAMQELQEQHRQIIAGEIPTHHKFPFSLAYNVIPHIDLMTDTGFTKEEMKMYNETRKILHSDIRVSATCVRVPTLRAHAEALWIETAAPLSVDALSQAISAAPGCVLAEPYPMPLQQSGQDAVAVGRIRQDLDDPCSFALFCVGDQIRKGAALNAVQIAELINGK